MIGKAEDIIVWLSTQEEDKIFEVKEHKNKRSLNANSYAWKLCGEIAKVMDTTKEEVYKKAIRDVGEFEVIPIRKDAVKRFISVWKSKGLGWLCEASPSKLDGYTNITAYFGSSVYDTKQMSRLINSLVQDAKALGVVTLDEIKIRELLEKYEKEGI